MNKSYRLAAMALALGFIPAAPLQAEGKCKVDSPAYRLGLLELFTSEGCSSCPPADRWLSRLRPSIRQDKLIPLAFHVDYWNQLGWPDRFSKAQYTQRQQWAAERNRAGFVYTPQFLLDGKDIRPLNLPDTLTTRLGALNAEPAGAHIAFSAELTALGEISVQGKSSLLRPDSPAQTFIAIYEHGLSSRVERGENAGKTLSHDYVVRSLVGPLLADTRGEVTLNHAVPIPLEANRKALGVAVFTQDAVTGRVLQASAIDGCLDLR